MARVEVLKTLSPAGEALLRARARARAGARGAGHSPDQSDQSIRGIADALVAGKLHAMGAFDDAGTMRGIAVWRWPDPAYAQVVVQYVEPDAPADWGERLVEDVFQMLIWQDALAVIEVRLRDTPPEMRAAWEARGCAVFERCRMTRALGHVPLPVAAIPGGYRVTRWESTHQDAVEQVARLAVKGSVDEVAVPDSRYDWVAVTLRRLRQEQYPGVESWLESASLVILDQRGSVVGYVAAVLERQTGVIAHLAVHPDHRRRGLARVLMIHCLYACQQRGLPAAGLAVTTRNPARSLYNQLGFQTVDCGEVAVWWRDGRQIDWRE